VIKQNSQWHIEKSEKKQANQIIKKLMFQIYYENILVPNELCILRNLTTMNGLSRRCGSFDVSQPYGPPRPVTGKSLPFYLRRTDTEKGVKYFIFNIIFYFWYIILPPHTDMLSNMCKMLDFSNIRYWVRISIAV
jgi:hypothetical protein